MISADGQHGATAPINFFRAYEQLFIDNGGTVLYRVEGLKLITPDAGYAGVGDDTRIELMHGTAGAGVVA